VDEVPENHLLACDAAAAGTGPTVVGSHDGVWDHQSTQALSAKGGKGLPEGNAARLFFVMVLWFPPPGISHLFIAVAAWRLDEVARSDVRMLKDATVPAGPRPGGASRCPSYVSSPLSLSTASVNQTVASASADQVALRRCGPEHWLAGPLMSHR